MEHPVVRCNRPGKRRLISCRVSHILPGRWLVKDEKPKPIKR